MQTAAKPLGIDEILKGPSMMPPPEPLSSMKKKPANGELSHTADDMRKLKARAERETAVNAATYYLLNHLTGSATLFGGDQLTVGAVIDNAITHYLSTVEAEWGKEICESLAELLIHNIALFINAAKRETVQKTVE